MTTVEELETRALNVLREKVACIIPELDPATISIDGNLEDSGCNSIDRTDIVWMIQEELGLNIPVAEFTGVSDIRSLITLLAHHMKAQ